MAQDLFSRLAQQTLAEVSADAPAAAGDDPVSAILQVAQERGIDPAHLLGLAKLETQAGRKTVKGDGADTRNLFNVKDFSRDGTGIRARDNAEGSNDRYRQYGSYRESVEDLVSLLERSYPGAAKAGSPEEFARELKRGGYATDPAYERKLASTIRSSLANVRPNQPAQEWDQGARYAPVGLMLAGTDKPKTAEDGEPESIVPSLGKAIWQGAKSLGRSVLASGNTALGDLSDVELLAEAQKADAKENPRAMMALQEEIAKRKKANPDAKWWQAIGDVGDAAWQNKLGTAQLIANQAPNSAVALGGGWAGGLAGAKLGALAAPFTGGLSVPVGAGLGALTGMFLGNYAMEAGGKALDKAEGGFTPEEARQSMTEGAKKAAVVTGVDTATLGAGKLVGRTVFGAPVRAGARAEAQVLANAGVDITNKAAIAQALATNQALKQTAIEAGKQAAKDASKFSTRAAQAGIDFGMETSGEGVGEYYGEVAATGKGDIYDAALEALSSASQSGVQTVQAMRSAEGNHLDPSGIVRAARQSGGIVSRAGLASTPGAQQQAATQQAQPAAQSAAQTGAAAQPAASQAAGSTAPTQAAPQQPEQTAIQASALSAIEQALEADKQRRRAAGEVVEDDVTEGDVVAAGDPPAAVLPDPPGAQASTPAQPATSAGFSLPAFDNSPLPKTDPAAAEEQRRQAAELEQKRKNRRAGTRAAVWERNPMLAFLGANGISRDAAGEFAPGLIERRKAFVPGYGPVFRPGAKNLDELVQNAKEDGFLREDDGEPELYDLIDRALRGERISPLYADGAAEAEGQRRLQAMQERDGADFEDYLAQAEAEDFDPFPLMDDSSYDEQDLAEIGRADVAVQNEVAALQQQYADLGFDPADVLESLATQTENLSDQAYYDLAKSRFIQLIDQAYGQSEAQAEQGGDRIVRLDTGPQGDAQEDGGAAGGQAAGPVTPPAAPFAASPKRADAIRAKLDTLKGQGFSQFTRSGGRTLLLNPDTYETVELTPAEMAVAKAAAGQTRASLQSLRGQRKPAQVDPQGADVLQSYTPADVLAQDEQAQAAQTQQTAEQQAAAAKAKADDERKRIEQASYAAADSFELGQNPLDSLTGQQDIFSTAPADAGSIERLRKDAENVFIGDVSDGDRSAEKTAIDAGIVAAINAGVPEEDVYNALFADGVTSTNLSRLISAAPVAADLAGERINDEWTTFGPQSGTLGIPRAEMPQIKAEHRGAMVNFLKARGIDGQQEAIPAAAIKPTQAEFSPAKVKQAMDYQDGNRSIIVSADGYVVDGHHQWLAAREKGEPIPTIRLDQNIGDVLTALKDMPSAQPEKQAKRPTQKQAQKVLGGESLEQLKKKVKPNADAFNKFKREGSEREFQALLEKYQKRQETPLSDDDIDRFIDLRTARNQAIYATENAGAEVDYSPEENPGAQPEQAAQTSYTPPEGNVSDAWIDAERRRPEHPDFQPNTRQQMLMDVVAKGIDAGVFYTRDMLDYAAKALNVPAEILDQNKTRVEGGDFGYDVYLARKAVEAKRARAQQIAVRDAMNLKPGDDLGTLIFTSDFKVNTNVVVDSVSDDGLTVVAKGKRGSYTVTLKTSPIGLKSGMDYAHEKGKRKGGYDEFVAGRTAKQPVKDTAQQADGQWTKQADAGDYQADSQTATAPSIITAEDVAAAEKQAAQMIEARIDSMKAADVQRIAVRFLPTVGVKAPMGKAKIKAAMTDAGAMGLLGSAGELGIELSESVERALVAKMEGRVGSVKPAMQPIAEPVNTNGMTQAEAAESVNPAGREGYDTPVELDAARLKAILEQTRGEPMVDKPAKLEAWRNGTAKTDPAKFPIELVFRPDGKLDANDGRHRIALAAERGEKVTAFIDGKDAQRAKDLLAMREQQAAISGAAAADLEAIFDQLDGITQRTQAAGQQAAAAHPKAERIQFVQKHILDILQDLEDGGKVTINC